MLSRSRKAFTLIELIVVIVILGILAALAIPTFAAVIEKSRVSTLESAAESIGRNAYALGAFDGVTDVEATVKNGTGTYLEASLDEAGGDLVAGTVTTDVETAALANGEYTLVLTFDGSSVDAVATKIVAPVVP